MPTKLWGYPPLPKKNAPANYACVSTLYVKNDDPNLARYFIEKVAEYSRQYDFLMLGLFESHPLKTIFKQIKHLKYQSRLYLVSWDNKQYNLNHRPINLEVSLL